MFVLQEVRADDTPAFQSVLEADTVRMNLLAKEAELTKQLEDGKSDAQAIAEKLKVCLLPVSTPHVNSGFFVFHILSTLREMLLL